MRPEKKAIVSEIRGKLDGSAFVILADCRGLTSEQMKDLRGHLRGAKAGMKVVPNALFGVAAKESGLQGMDQFLTGPTALVSGPGDVTQVAKILRTYIKDTNNKPVLGTAVDPRVPDGRIDMVLCVDVYHEFSHPEEMLRQLRASLAPQGRLVLAEFRGEDPAVPIKPLHKMTKAQIRAELEPAGFTVVREFDRLPWQHLVFLAATAADGDRQGQSPSR